MLVYIFSVCLGLYLQKVEELFKGNEYVNEVSADLKRAKQLGVTGVPTFVINDNYKQKFSGGRGADFWLSTFNALGLDVDK